MYACPQHVPQPIPQAWFNPRVSHSIHLRLSLTHDANLENLFRLKVQSRCHYKSVVCEVPRPPPKHPEVKHTCPTPSKALTCRLLLHTWQQYSVDVFIALSTRSWDKNEKKKTYTCQMPSQGDEKYEQVRSKKIEGGGEGQIWKNMKREHNPVGGQGCFHSISLKVSWLL